MLLLLLCPTDMRAQYLQATLSHYTATDGLPSNSISSVMYG